MTQGFEPLHHQPRRFTVEDMTAASDAFLQHVPDGVLRRCDYDQTLMFRANGRDLRFRIQGVLAGHRRRDYAIRAMTDKAIAHFTTTESQP